MARSSKNETKTRTPAQRQALAPATPLTQQTVTGSIIRGTTTQSSDQARTHQTFASSSTDKLSQSVTVDKDEIKAFGVHGRGLVAVVVAGVIVVSLLIFKYLLQ